MKLRLMLLLFIGLSFGLRATVTGYERFYNERTNTLIDLIYDTHVYQDKLSWKDFHEKSRTYVEQRLYPTEKRLMQALRKLNQETPGCVDVIWEEGIYYDDSAEQFIGHSERLIKEQFTNLNFIASDVTRDAFEQLFNAPGQRSLNKEVAGISMNNLMPLPDERIASIIGNSGDKAWENFSQYHKQKLQGVRGFFNQLYLDGTTLERRELRESNHWCTLTDLEMLSYILGSNKPHIIVYAGGWHSKNIARFLEASTDFKLVYSVHDGGYEIDEGHLGLIDSLNGYDPALYKIAMSQAE